MNRLAKTEFFKGTFKEALGAFGMPVSTGSYNDEGELVRVYKFANGMVIHSDGNKYVSAIHIVLV